MGKDSGTAGSHIVSGLFCSWGGQWTIFGYFISFSHNSRGFIRILMPYFFKNCLIYMVNEELGGNRPFFKPMLRFYPDFDHFLHSEPFLTVLEAFACRLL